MPSTEILPDWTAPAMCSDFQWFFTTDSSKELTDRARWVCLLPFMDKAEEGKGTRSFITVSTWMSIKCKHP